MCGFVAVATEWLITHHCVLSILDGLFFMFGEKHWNRGAVKYLDTSMEGMVYYQDWEIFSLRISAGTGIIAVLPGNHEEFLR